MARARSRFDVEDTAPRSDVYTGLLALSLIAMIVSTLLLYLDYTQYGATKAPTVTMPPPKVRENVQTGQLPPLMLPPPGPIGERPFTKAPDATVSKPVKPVGGEEAQAPPAPTPAPIPAPTLEPPQPMPTPAEPVQVPPTPVEKPSATAPGAPPPPPLPKSIRSLPQ
jgi:hypothetical protein